MVHVNRRYNVTTLSPQERGCEVYNLNVFECEREHVDHHEDEGEQVYAQCRGPGTKTNL